MNPGRISIRKPTAVFRPKEVAPTFDLNRSIKGLRVGIRSDQFWPSWFVIRDVWTDMLREDGAEPVFLEISERVGEGGKGTQAEVERWAASVDCAVVGLAN